MLSRMDNKDRFIRKQPLLQQNYIRRRSIKLNVIKLDLNDWNLCVKIRIFSIHSMNRRANWSLSERFPFFSPQSPYDMKESGTRSKCRHKEASAKERAN